MIRAVHEGVAWSAGEGEEPAPRRVEGEAARALLELSDFDGPLVDPKRKGHDVELADRLIIPS